MYSDEQLAANLPELIKELGDRGKGRSSMSPIGGIEPGISFRKISFCFCLCSTLIVKNCFIVP